MMRFGFLMAAAALGAGALGLALTAACLERFEPVGGDAVVAVRLRIELAGAPPDSPGIAETRASAWRPVALEADLRRSRRSGEDGPGHAGRILACGRALLRVGLRLTVTLLHLGAGWLPAPGA